MEVTVGFDPKFYLLAAVIVPVTICLMWVLIEMGITTRAIRKKIKEGAL